MKAAQETTTKVETTITIEMDYEQARELWQQLHTGLKYYHGVPLGTPVEKVVDFRNLLHTILIEADRERSARAPKAYQSIIPS